jgi:ADP-heptose:LPS heptosyltransferase
MFLMAPGSPSALIIRLDAIGDALALTPLLAALLGRGIPVDLVLNEGNAKIFASRATRDVFVAPFEQRSSTRANLASIAKFGAELRNNNYSHVLVATEDPGGYRLARAVGAPNRVGFVNGFGKPLKTVWASTFLTQTLYRSAGLDRSAPHECNVLFELGRTLLDDDVHATQDTQTLRALVLERDVPPGTNIVFQVTDKWERLGIAFDDVVLALQAMSLRGSVRAITAESERAYAERVSVASRMEVETLSDLESWKEAIGSAAMLVAPDSGAIHVAGMIGTPVIGVFPVENFDLQVARWAPWASVSRIIPAQPGWPSKI